MFYQASDYPAMVMLINLLRMFRRHHYSNSIIMAGSQSKNNFSLFHCFISSNGCVIFCTAKKKKFGRAVVESAAA